MVKSTSLGKCHFCHGENVGNICFLGAGREMFLVSYKQDNGVSLQILLLQNKSINVRVTQSDGSTEVPQRSKYGPAVLQILSNGW